MQLTEVFTLILTIVTGIGVIIYYCMHRTRKRENDAPVIKEIIRGFINPTVHFIDIYVLRFKSFNYPESLNDFYMILKTDLQKRFSKRARITSWRIKDFNKLCFKINTAIEELAKKSKGKNIVKYITDQHGEHLILTEQYENLSKEEIAKVLHDNNLNHDIENIERSMRELQRRARTISKSLMRLRRKWAEEYSLTYETTVT